MSLSHLILDVLSRDAQATLYFTQSATYGLAFWATRHGGHAPWPVYLASCLVHCILGVLHHWPPG